MKNVPDFIQFDAITHQLVCHGDWQLSNLNAIKRALERIIDTSNTAITISGGALQRMDSAGAFILASHLARLAANNRTVSLVDFTEQHQQLLSHAQALLQKNNTLPIKKKLSLLELMGKYAIERTFEFIDLLSFIGKIALGTLSTLYNPFKWRWNSIMHVINATGSSALPIIALLSFMIGIVISYQMGNQLRNYGANIFIVSLLGLSILREFGPLITAIMIAGRTGSAFTAEIGIMKINQEVDALNTMGVKTDALLIFPRLIGLVIVMPLLTVWADIFGIIGGMVMAQNMLDISWFDFLQRFKATIPLRAFLIGLGKAPLFGLIIACIGCFQGMKVKGSAESVGTRTTKSVVMAIFLIVIVDAFLSVLLSKYKL